MWGGAEGGGNVAAHAHQDEPEGDSPLLLLASRRAWRCGKTPAISWFGNFSKRAIYHNPNHNATIPTCRARLCGRRGSSASGAAVTRTTRWGAALREILQQAEIADVAVARMGGPGMRGVSYHVLFSGNVSGSYPMILGAGGGLVLGRRNGRQHATGSAGLPLSGTPGYTKNECFLYWSTGSTATDGLSCDGMLPYTGRTMRWWHSQHIGPVCFRPPVRVVRDAQRRLEELRAYAEELGVADCVDWLVNAPYAELRSLLGEAVGGLHTMTDEHFGISVVEYMAAGVVPIAHNSGGCCMKGKDDYNGVDLLSHGCKGHQRRGVHGGGGGAHRAQLRWVWDKMHICTSR